MLFGGHVSSDHQATEQGRLDGPCAGQRRHRSDFRARYLSAPDYRRLGLALDQAAEADPVKVLSHPGRYADIAPNLRAKEVVLGEGARRRRYILCLNQDEADRQKWRRAELLQTLEAELEALTKDHPKAACRLVASKRYGRYLGVDDQGRPYLDNEKLRRAAHLDGKFVLTTNDDTLSVADIALGYKGM